MPDTVEPQDTTEKTPPEKPIVQQDGRRRRSERSREKIIDALFNLVRAGDIEASAQKVADAAGMSLRTVFRHFEEVDLIYREMSSRVEAEVMPIVTASFDAADWHGQLIEVIERRAHVYDHIMLLKLAGGIRRFGSKTLMENHNWFVARERETLARITRAFLRQDSTTFHALDTTLSFEAWRRYRQDLKLSANDTKKAMLFSVDALLGGLD